jgi:hypothetical protein
MPTLGTQNISTSYPQLLKTFGTGGLDGNLQIITDGDNTSSALSLSTTGVQSTGSLAVDGTSLLTGAVTFGGSLTASTGTATIGTLSASTATISTATVSTATISTATISTATIPTVLGAVTFASSITASTGTNTLGTITSNYVTAGTQQFGASGPKLTAVSYGTAAFSASTAPQYNSAGTTTGTFALTGAALGDIVIGSINSLGSATGTVLFATDFHVASANVVRYNLLNQGSTAGTVPAGTIFATALRFTS